MGCVEPLQARARCIVAGRSGIHEPDYPGTIQYVLRRRDRFGFWTAVFLFALSAALLTVAAVSVATGYASVAGVWDFLVFGLLMAAGGIFGLRGRAAIAGQVLIAVGDAGIYLTEPPVHPVARGRGTGRLPQLAGRRRCRLREVAFADGRRVRRRGLPARCGCPAPARPGPVWRDGGSARREGPPR